MSVWLRLLPQTVQRIALFDFHTPIGGLQWCLFRLSAPFSGLWRCFGGKIAYFFSI
jgi:hypothetical protein